MTDVDPTADPDQDTIERWTAPTPFRKLTNRQVAAVERQERTIGSPTAQPEDNE